MMRWTHRQLWLAALGLGAVAAVIATGMLGDTGTPDTGPVGAGVTGMLDSPGPDPADDPARADRRTVITLGALDPPPTTSNGGAPFDPCTVIGWPDLPTPVRPATDATPRPCPARQRRGRQPRVPLRQQRPDRGVHRDDHLGHHPTARAQPGELPRRHRDHLW